MMGGVRGGLRGGGGMGVGVGGGGVLAKWPYETPPGQFNRIVGREKFRNSFTIWTDIGRSSGINCQHLRGILYREWPRNSLVPIGHSATLYLLRQPIGKQNAWTVVAFTPANRKAGKCCVYSLTCGQLNLLSGQVTAVQFFSSVPSVQSWIFNSVLT